MTGTLAQLIALTAYGNAYLKTGNLLDFYPINTTFQFCKSVDFIAFEKPVFFSNFSKPKETIVAATPTDWFKLLKKDGCKKLRLYFQYSKDQSLAQDHKLAGMVGGGGTWLVETIYDNDSDYWANRWKVKDQDAPDRKIWKVSYVMTTSHNKTTNLQVDLDSIKEKISKTLTEISDFAYQHDFKDWEELFDKAKATLSDKNPKENFYHKVSLRLTTPLYKFGIKYLSQRFPVMRQQFIYFIDGVSIDSLQNIPEPDERVYAVEFAGTH